jgi:hypothetical protein
MASRSGSSACGWAPATPHEPMPTVNRASGPRCMSIHCMVFRRMCSSPSAIASATPLPSPASLVGAKPSPREHDIGSPAQSCHWLPRISAQSSLPSAQWRHTPLPTRTASARGHPRTGPKSSLMTPAAALRATCTWWHRDDLTNCGTETRHLTRANRAPSWAVPARMLTGR